MNRGTDRGKNNGDSLARTAAEIARLGSVKVRPLSRIEQEVKRVLANPINPKLIRGLRPVTVKAIEQRMASRATTSLIIDTVSPRRLLREIEGKREEQRHQEVLMELRAAGGRSLRRDIGLTSFGAVIGAIAGWLVPRLFG